MKRLTGLALPVALVVMLVATADQVQAGCPACGGGGGGYGGWYPLGGYDAWTFIDREPNHFNLYPNAAVLGNTAYDGLWATGWEAHSNYSPINWVRSPADNAQAVLDKLKEMNIPRVSPEPIYLGKNPRIAENIQLPVPRMKKTKDTKEGE